MGFRFQKRIRLFKGLTLNLSKTGTSLSVGGPGASINLKGDKVTGTVGVPGTGMSYRNAAPEAALFWGVGVGVRRNATPGDHKAQNKTGATRAPVIQLCVLLRIGR